MRQVVLIVAAALLSCQGTTFSDFDAGSGGGSGSNGGGVGGGTAGGSGGGGGSAGGGTGGGGAVPCTNQADGGAAAIVVRVDGGVRAGSILVSDSTEIRLEGFTPCTEVTVEFHIPAPDAGYRSWARFAVPSSGNVSTFNQAPSAGTYFEIDPDGPFWSMDGPQVEITDWSVEVLAFDDAGRSASAVIAREIAPSSVTVTAVSSMGVVGELYTPAGAGPFAAVMTIGGSEGGLKGARFMAKSLAAEGVMTFAVAYFAEGSLPAQLHSIPLEYFSTALDVLRAQPKVRSDRVAVMGASRGGEAALLIGATFPSKVQAVIAVVPSGYVWPSWGIWNKSSWTVGGTDLPFVPWSNQNPNTTTNDAGMRFYFQNVMFSSSLNLATLPALKAAEIAAEKIAGPVQIFASAQDGVWPSCRMAQVAWNRLADAGHDAGAGLDGYDCAIGAGHALNPARVGLPMFPALYSLYSGNDYVAAGGSARDSAQGSRRARTQVNRLLEWLKR